MLRLVSFNMDYYWACRGIGLPEVSMSEIAYMQHALTTGQTSLSDKHRPRVNHSLDTYSYLNYAAYALYPPLYIAGPIMTFNDFMWQVGLIRIVWNEILF